MGCTTLLVGKKASYDGSTLMARNEDSGYGSYNPKKFVVVNPEDQPRKYKSVCSSFSIELEDNPLRYTTMSNATEGEGIWAASGINQLNVAMTATETITSNYLVLAADPLVKEGIGEEDMVTIVLPYIHSAKEGVERLGSLLEKYGTYEKNGIGFQDENEIWWLETLGGHHWISVRLKDDHYSVIANQLGIDYFDFVDAYSDQKENMCSKDLKDFIRNNHLDRDLDNCDLDNCKKFDVRLAFGSHSDHDHSYSSPRVWFSQRYLNRNTYKWDGVDADFNPESDNLPFSLKPERKIAIDDMKYILSSVYQSTEYDPYSKYASQSGKYRVIGVNRNNFLAITQIRDYVAEEFKAIKWMAFGPNPFNCLLAQYSNVTVSPAYLANVSGEVTTENLYWASRIIATIADKHYISTQSLIDNYSQSVLNESMRLINECDKKLLEDSSDVNSKLEACNQQISDKVKELTNKLLANLVYLASNSMKNGYSRSDS